MGSRQEGGNGFEVNNKIPFSPGWMMSEIKKCRSSASWSLSGLKSLVVQLTHEWSVHGLFQVSKCASFPAFSSWSQTRSRRDFCVPSCEFLRQRY